MRSSGISLAAIRHLQRPPWSETLFSQLPPSYANYPANCRRILPSAALSCEASINTLTYSHSLSLTHSHSLSPTLTHSHLLPLSLILTHSHSLSLTVCRICHRKRWLSLQERTYSQTAALSCEESMNGGSHTHSLSHTHSHTHTHTHSHTLTLTLTRTHRVGRGGADPDTLTHTHSHSHPLTPTHTPTLFLTHSQARTTSPTVT